MAENVYEKLASMDGPVTLEECTGSNFFDDRIIGCHEGEAVKAGVLTGQNGTGGKQTFRTGPYIIDVDNGDYGVDVEVDIADEDVRN